MKTDSNPLENLSRIICGFSSFRLDYGAMIVEWENKKLQKLCRCSCVWCTQSVRNKNVWSAIYINSKNQWSASNSVDIWTLDFSDIKKCNSWFNLAKRRFHLNLNALAQTTSTRTQWRVFSLAVVLYGASLYAYFLFCFRKWLFIVTFNMFCWCCCCCCRFWQRV